MATTSSAYSSVAYSTSSATTSSATTSSAYSSSTTTSSVATSSSAYSPSAYSCSTSYGHSVITGAIAGTVETEEGITSNSILKLPVGVLCELRISIGIILGSALIASAGIGVLSYLLGSAIPCLRNSSAKLSIAASVAL